MRLPLHSFLARSVSKNEAHLASRSTAPLDLVRSPSGHFRRARSAASLRLVATSLVLVMHSGSLFALVSTAPAVPVPARTAARLTQARLAGLLRQGVETRRVPHNLVPPLTEAKQDVSLAWSDGCLVGGNATTNKTGCVFGDTNSHTTIVLFGDSHAAAWFPAVDAISQRQHWRLVFMGKVGCPAADVVVRHHDGSPYTTCLTWRHNSERQIAELHPAMVVVTSSEYRASPADNVPTGHGNTWLNGLAAAFKALHRGTTHVVFVADVPRLKQPAVDCISAHIADVFPCTVARRKAFLWPNIRQRELKLAKAEGVVGIDPAPWFCTPDRCPVIADNMLIFRDGQHIMPEWSAFLAPLLEARLVRAIQ
jgi:hypothetical protein